MPGLGCCPHGHAISQTSSNSKRQRANAPAYRISTSETN